MNGLKSSIINVRTSWGMFKHNDFRLVTLGSKPTKYLFGNDGYTTYLTDDGCYYYLSPSRSYLQRLGVQNELG
jgi:hypothetical protein